ncbi:MAG TPA: Smr/MutS family protein [Rhizomicrobium sp.]|nr:Smr/MutS family protein [Rhizomicrobium sp.]
MTRRKRETSEEEKTLFRETFRDVRPHLPATSKKSVDKSEKRKDDARPSPRPVHTGVNGRTSERLCRGLLEPQSRLDLHGLTEVAAHRTLERFLQNAHAQGLRLVLVVTGKGLKPAADDEPFDLELHARSRGVLRTMVPRWLKEAPLAALVAEVRAAHRRHGGGGAIYIYLRKATR